MSIARTRSYEDVVIAHAPALLRLAVMLAGNRADAEDLLQSTLLRAARHGDRVAGMGAPAAYLRRVMLNEHTSNGRRSRRRVATVESVQSAEATVASGADAFDERDEAWRWLATLKPQQRSVLVLRYYEDLPDVEIAALLGCAEATVRSHALRGLTALRGRLTTHRRGSEWT
ncbi:sigma-70 family RNA polymerase sigma factor [Nocardioides sp.]|uniref:RNA polymerase sigma factor n=1 Tax=Nocardioides sp. TaxID=35761 RepID=UPI0031FE5EFB|nr:polymerase, sigma-24 subunit, subfamily [Nocardioides sp.]